MTNVLNSAVLLLNNTYEPLNVINVTRALRLITTQKASGVEKEGYDLHSSKGVLCIPVVVKMAYYVKRPMQKVKFSKRHVLMRDNFTCQYCNDRPKELTIDHVVPKTSGGLTVWTNVVACCKRCNSAKGDKTLKDSGLKLKRAPKEPRFLPYLRMIKGGSNHAWEKYLFTDSNSPYLIRGELPKEAVKK